MSSDLENLVQMARVGKGACGPLIQRAISSRKIFVFGELLDEENIQALRGTALDKEFNTLELFAYGTYGDYKGHFRIIGLKQLYSNEFYLFLK